MKTIRMAVWALAALVAAPAAAETLHPAAQATIRKLPELGIFEVVLPSNPIQSTYARTTEINREFRRGIAEFTIPSGTILGATLVLTENRATIATPMPPDLHHLTAFGSADLVVTTDDYDRTGTEVSTFATDVNEAQQTFTFDVTTLVAAAAGGTLGFRVRLDVDPDNTGSTALGSAFDVSLEIVTPPTAVSRRSWGTLKRSYR